MQRDDVGRDVVVAYASRALHRSEKPYSTPEMVVLEDSPKVQRLQLEDAVIGVLLSQLESGHQDDH